MSTEARSDTLDIGPWRAERMTGRLVSAAGETRMLEPKVMDLLFLLGARPGEVLSRDEIMAALWPGVTVGEDTLARNVAKLRKALGDETASPRYLETIPKRGYRLIAAPRPAGEATAPPGALPFRLLGMALAGVLVALVVVGLLLAPRMAAQGKAGAAAELTRRGDDAYFQFTRADNEAAIDFYRRALAAEPDNAGALAGLANATVQTVIRWPEAPGRRELIRTNLGEALAEGRTRTPPARQALSSARVLAERAVQVAPRDAAAHKALGFVRSAQGDFDGAMAAYREALKHDPHAWGVMINIGDVLEIRGDEAQALPWLERAYAAMSKAYDTEALRVRPWQAELGVAIAGRYAELGRPKQAEGWYRRVLGQSPLNREATVGLAKVVAGRDGVEARRLCRELVERTGPAEGCAAYL